MWAYAWVVGALLHTKLVWGNKGVNQERHGKIRKSPLVSNNSGGYDLSFSTSIQPTVHIRPNACHINSSDIAPVEPTGSAVDWHSVAFFGMLICFPSSTGKYTSKAIPSIFVVSMYPPLRPQPFTAAKHTD